MFTLVTVVVGVIATILVSVFAVVTNSAMALPAVATAATAYAAAHRDVHGALWTALVLGVIAGMPLGPSRGVELIALLVVIAATRAARRILPLRRRFVLVGWVVVATVIADLTFVLASVLLTPRLSVWTALWRVTPMAALVSGAVAWPMFFVLDRVEPVLRARQERSTLLGT